MATSLDHESLRKLIQLDAVLFEDLKTSMRAKSVCDIRDKAELRRLIAPVFGEERFKLPCVITNISEVDGRSMVELDCSIVFAKSKCEWGVLSPYQLAVSREEAEAVAVDAEAVVSGNPFLYLGTRLDKDDVYDQAKATHEHIKIQIAYAKDRRMIRQVLLLTDPRLE